MKVNMGNITALTQKHLGPMNKKESKQSTIGPERLGLDRSGIAWTQSWFVPITKKSHWGMLPLGLILVLGLLAISCGEGTSDEVLSEFQKVRLTSVEGHNGKQSWHMIADSLTNGRGEEFSSASYTVENWLPAVVPGTVLTNLVKNGIMPDPYYGINNKRDEHLIPDVHDKGRDFYTYWFRTTFDSPEVGEDGRTWLKFEGINYGAEIYLNGKRLGDIKGMFVTPEFDVTDVIYNNGPNALAVKVMPVEHPGTEMMKTRNNVKTNENQNGGNGMIGKDVTMLMSAGWDFTFADGIRDRNTGIWRDVMLFTTGAVKLDAPFVTSDLELPFMDRSKQTLSVTVTNHSGQPQKGYLSAEIDGTGVSLKQEVSLLAGETREVVFSPTEYPELVLEDPKVWWPINKGEQPLYKATFTFMDGNGTAQDHASTRFGIRSITSDTNTPDNSRAFYVNGEQLFVRGSNWIPEAMLNTSDLRYRTELEWTREAGINLLRLWGGGISESNLFFDLCDELGILVWHEFWMTGDTQPPSDTELYYQNVRSTIKRIRNHPSLAYYVSSNEQDDIISIKPILDELDGTRGYQYQSECCGVHDGSPYKYENPMQYYDDTASDRGSRIYGFCPEYGSVTLPNVEILREMMDENDLFPPNKEVWDYLDGNGFHYVTTKYDNAIKQFGPSETIEEYAFKGQMVGATAFRSIWENWNYNKLDFGDRYTTGVLFWYHNSPVRQVCSRLWDWSLEPNAAFYYTKKALEPLHLQYDYIKNTVSLVNDLPKGFTDLTAKIDIYNIDASNVYEESIKVSPGPEEVMNDILTVDLPRDLSQVHFIKLQLMDGEGSLISDNFYWRSKDVYEGPWTTTGPIYSGFEALNDLPEVDLGMSVTDQGQKKDRYLVRLSNPSGDIAFFNRLKVMDPKGELVRPVIFSDNFFSLLPGEERTVELRFMDMGNIPLEFQVEHEGWNGAVKQ